MLVIDAGPALFADMAAEASPLLPRAKESTPQEEPERD
jgi:hypothetical protein